ncbi:hypothetical protein [Chryseobacterium sp. SL1]|uniref:hypothetical protein n=1 Tax=Chryseobacterium sp. SL1 TaxID=2995159 RepID=UPI002275FFF6|nr:hypothetical protein [Chryseobacterium sp. SL1]MCY1662245.1 hypothetical protein [Chryseobacterium sp. SL1]
MMTVLSCGPIFEPLMGALFSTVSCIGILIFLAVRFFKGEAYTLLKNSGTANKTFSIILYGVAGIIVTAFVWFILTFMFTALVFWYTKNF